MASYLLDFTDITLQPAEREWLQSACPYFTPEYLDFLSAYRFKPEQVQITFVPYTDNSERGTIDIVMSGPWVETILWEVPILACISETYYNTIEEDCPSFRSMHEVIHHTTWVDILDCCLCVVKDVHQCETLQAWAESEPTWEDVISVSHAVVVRYLPGAGIVDEREKEKKERDTVFENLCLRNQHGLLYLELSRAMNYGYVGRILELIPYYIAIFTATGKDKYARHMIKFLTDLKYVYPPRLGEAILQNWLCNTKGTPDGFRALDWLQELNNLYTKADEGLLTARGMQSADVGKVAELMRVNIHVEKPHESILGVTVGELGGPMYELTTLITGVLNETGDILVGAGYPDLGTFVAQALELANDAEAILERASQHRLVRAIPAFRDMALVNGHPIYCFKKAPFPINGIRVRFGAASSSPFPIPPSTSHLPIFSDNVIPSLLVHLGVIDISASPILRGVPSDSHSEKKIASLLEISDVSGVAPGRA
ncbi:hypothetical protein ARMSODRAFT_1012942 [Armillaria solidipes]|uniref:Queuosine 5'-phosphate N-glycosylase/hydrolase n=1 Tax=Armillaria solidipes TaxID=1076256 RepID=A0A2H3BXC9_9AGAR|nr:hypothetical protein ARMSODRAFT_1012942 [Armillaria solidipes]